MPNNDKVAARIADFASSYGSLDVQAQALTSTGGYRRVARPSTSSSTPRPVPSKSQSRPVPTASERPPNLDGTEVYPKDVGAAGTGLFASKDFDRGELMIRIERPLGCELDTPLLERLCGWCLRGKNVARMEVFEEVEVKKCGGCGVNRFCGEKCQKAAWKSHHKYECKVFKALWPKVLPHTVRMAVQFLLLRQNGVLSDSEWSKLTRLQHHVVDFRKQKAANEAENFALMAKAAQKYSGTKEDLALVESLLGRILINTLTLVDASYDPLGLAFSPEAALINHSCAPNAVISFSSTALSVRSLVPISVDTEITISYIDNTDSQLIRQLELNSRYFFNCACFLCIASRPCTLSRANLDPPRELSIALQPDVLEALDYSVRSAIDECHSLSDPMLRVKKLRSAMMEIAPHAQKKYYPVHRQPYARLRSELVLALLPAKHWVEAFLQSLIIFIYIDPVHFPQAFHPVRIAHKWVMLKLVTLMANLAHEGEKEVLEMFENLPINFGKIAFGLLRDIDKNLEQSYGKDSRFAKIVSNERKLFRWAEEGELKVTDKDLNVMWGQLKYLVGESLVYGG